MDVVDVLSLSVIQLPGFVNVTNPDVCLEDLHEEEPHNMTVGISIQNLAKIYDDVSITFPIYTCTYTCLASFMGCTHMYT